MSMAIKCDRCNKCFDPYNTHGLSFARFSNPRFVNDSDYKRQKITSTWLKAADGYPDCHAEIDLCPDCQQEFLLFMDMIEDSAKITDPLTENGRSV